MPHLNVINTGDLSPPSIRHLKIFYLTMNRLANNAGFFLFPLMFYLYCLMNFNFLGLHMLHYSNHMPLCSTDLTQTVERLAYKGRVCLNHTSSLFFQIKYFGND